MCYLINENTYKQKSFVLGCKRMKGKHNYLNIAQVITDIIENYKIDSLKITHTVTDNVTNFSKLNRTFSKALPIELQSNSNTKSYFDEDNGLSTCLFLHLPR